MSARHGLRPREMAAAPEAARGISPGWLVVAGAFLVQMVGYGAIYSYSAFAEAIAASFGAARAEVALVYALSGGSCFLVSGLSGPLADRIGARIVALAGMLLLGLGLVIAAGAQSMIEVYAGYGLLIGLGAGFAVVPAMAAVQRWFARHRGLASGIASAGVGIGTVLVPPLAELLGRFGDWRVAFAACGGLAMLVGGAGALMLKPAPMSRPVPQHGAALPRRGIALAYGGTLLVSLGIALPYALLVETARDLGLPPREAVALLGLIGLGSIAGRFVLGALADLLGRGRIFLGCCAAVGASLPLWAMAEGPLALQGFALIFGAAQGGFVALLPAFAADRFGVPRVGTVLGLLYTGRGVALLAAPVGVTLAIAAIGSPAPPLLFVAALVLAGTALLAAGRR